MPSLMPSFSPSLQPSSRPSKCAAIYDIDESSQNFGNLLQCGSDSDCGGFELSDGSTVGASCNLDSCECECDAKYCLANESGGGTGGDQTCQFQCDCKGGCTSVNDPNILEGDLSWDNKNKDQCDLAECTVCTDDTGCSFDQDCIIDNGSGICVESGICTSSKNDVCDEAYSAVTQNSNNRAKCCPSSSSCVKTIIGVIDSSTCSTNCGGCLGSASNPGTDKGYSPSTFCLYGNRV
eukprot:8611591-Ditylum_brightwellii.AAC.1